MPQAAAAAIKVLVVDDDESIRGLLARVQFRAVKP